MKMKKMLALLLAGAMTLSVVACGQTNEESKQEESGSSVAESKTEETKSEEPKEVPTLSWLVPGDPQQDIAAVLEKLNEITEVEIGAKIDIQFIETSSFKERMKMNMASGLDYDLCFTGAYNKYVDAIKNEALLDITDYIESDPEFMAALPEYAWDVARYNECIYGVPNIQGFANEDSLAIDKEMAEKYNLNVDEITSVQDLEPFMEAVKAANEKDFFIWRTSSAALRMFYCKDWIETDGFAVYTRNPEGKVTVVARQDIPEWTQGVETLHEWYEAGYIRTDVLSAGDDSAERNAGKFIIDYASYTPGTEVKLGSQRGRDVECIHIVEPLMTTKQAQSTLISVGVDSKYPDEAVAFIKLIHTNQEVYDLVCYGIEGKHYNLNDEGKVVKVENSGYNPNANWKFGNTLNALLVEGDSEETVELIKEMNLNATKDVLMGFVFDNTAVATEVANLNAVTSEYSYFYTGAVDPDEYLDEFVKKMEEAGQEKIIAELQRQIDEFLGQ